MHRGFPVNVSMLLFGLAVAWTSTVLPQLMDAGVVSEEDASWLSSTFALTVCLGSAPCSYVAQRWGRKRAIYLTVAAPFLLHWFLMVAFPGSLVLMHTARIILGIAIGAGTVVNPMYVNETAQDSVRGAAGLFLAVLINSGLLLGFVISCFFPGVVLNSVGLAVSIVYFFGVFWLPETPLYLLMKRKMSDATASLKRLRGGNDVDVTYEIEKKLISVKSQNASGVSLRQLVSSKANLKGFIIGMAIFGNQQVAGAYVMISNTVMIFREAGTNISPNVASVVVGATNVVATLVSVAFVERAGRKVLLLLSNAVLFLCLVTLGVYHYYKDVLFVDVSSWRTLPVVCLSFYVAALNLGVGPLPFVIASEVIRSQFLGPIFTLILLFNCVLTFAMLKFYFSMVSFLGDHGCYWLFASFCVLEAIFIVTVIPETKGRPQEEIILELKGKRVRKGKAENEEEASTLS